MLYLDNWQLKFLFLNYLRSKKGCMIKLTPKELLTLHMDCMFTYEKSRMVYVNEPWGCTTPAPLLMLGHTVEDDILCRFGKYANASLIKKVESLVYSGVWDISIYQKELGIQNSSQELCFYTKSTGVDCTNCRLLTGEDEKLLETTFKGYAEEISTAQPYVGYFCDGKIVSICRSVRKEHGHEAGIETLPEYRRRGYAQAVLKYWTMAVLQQGFIPLYSADVANTASLQLARKSQYILYASAFVLK